MTKPTKTQIDTLRVGIDNLVRRFKIAEAGPAVEGALKLNPIDVQALLFIADHPGCTSCLISARFELTVSESGRGTTILPLRVSGT